MRDGLNAGFEPRLAGLPAGAAELVERNVLALASVTGNEVDILDRQVKLVAAGVDDAQAIMRCRIDRDRLQPFIAADAVIDVDDEIAGAECRGFFQEVLRPAAAAAPHHPLAEDVGFGDHAQVVCEKTLVER